MIYCAQRHLYNAATGMVIACLSVCLAQLKSYIAIAVSGLEHHMQGLRHITVSCVSSSL